MTAVPGRVSVSAPTDRTIRTESIVGAPRDLVWRAYSEPDLVARWWGRGNRVDVERWETKRGGHWRLVEHADGDSYGFEGRFREVTPPESMVWTFEWDGMPGYVSLQTVTFEAIDANHTKIVTDSIFFTTEERDGMLNTDMEQGMNQSYQALERVLASLAEDTA